MRSCLVLLKKPEGFELQELSEVTSWPSEAVLVGGFSEELEEGSPPSSPTLKINADLGTFSREFLKALALAEKRRLEENIYRSYLYDTRGRILVLSRDPEALQKFLETYGGILELFPVVLETPARGMPVALRASLETFSGGVRFRFVQKVPVDYEKCTRCGVCGPVCSPEALLPGPEIDFQKCDLCGECVKVCPTGALDLHRYEEVTVEASYAVLLGETGLEIPGGRGRIFNEKNLEELWTLLGEHQIDEVVVFERDKCQYSFRLGIGCERCIRVCPKEALQREEEGLRVDHLRCEGCGACVAVCPTGALDYAPFREGSLFRYLACLPLPENITVVVAREEVLQTLWWRYNHRRFSRIFFLEHPQPRALGAGILLYLLARGAGQIILVEGDTRHAELANLILEHLGGERRITLLSPQEFYQHFPPEEKKSLWRKPLEAPEKSGRREAFAWVLTHLLEEVTSKTGALLLEAEDFGEVACEASRCSLCGACLNECRTRALQVDTEHYVLYHQPILCVQCGLCVQICPERALELRPGLRLEEKFLKPRELARDEPVKCPLCGRIFGTRKSLERVRSKLSEAGLWEEVGRFLEYCENCRVIKRLEEGRF